MARILQTGFEVPPGLTFSGTNLAWFNLNGVTGLNTLGLPVQFSQDSGSSSNYNHCTLTNPANSGSHKSVTGLGGSAVLQFGYQDRVGANFDLPFSAKEGFFSFAVKAVATFYDNIPADPGYSFKISLWNGGTLLAGGYQHSASNLHVTSSVVNGTLASPAPVPLVLDTSIWHWVTLGWTETTTSLWVNTAGSSPVLTYTGLTSGLNRIKIRMNGTAQPFAIDDVVVHVPTISFENCSSISSAPTGVITGSNSGATANITTVDFSDSVYGVANTGRLYVYGVTGTFQNGEQISNSDGSWTATIKFAGGGEGGLDINSGKPGETFIYSLSLTGDKAGGIQMTGSDGNQVNNYALINEPLANDTTYVQAAGLDTALDLYTMSDLPSTIQSVTGISITTRAKKAGAIGKLIPAIDINNSVQYPGTPIDISTDYIYKKRFKVIDVNDVTNDLFTREQINNANIGLRFK